LSKALNEPDAKQVSKYFSRGQVSIIEKTMYSNNKHEARIKFALHFSLVVVRHSMAYFLQKLTYLLKETYRVSIKPL
jgi:hypothetical protein